MKKRRSFYVGSRCGSLQSMHALAAAAILVVMAMVPAAEILTLPLSSSVSAVKVEPGLKPNQPNLRAILNIFFFYDKIKKN